MRSRSYRAPEAWRAHGEREKAAWIEAAAKVTARVQRRRCHPTHR